MRRSRLSGLAARVLRPAVRPTADRTAQCGDDDRCPRGHRTRRRGRGDDSPIGCTGRPTARCRPALHELRTAEHRCGDAPGGHRPPRPPHPGDWFCTGPLGTDADGREIFADCGPIVEEGFVQWACTGRVGVDDIGRTRFAGCELAPSPAGPGFEVVTPDGSVVTPTYTVRAGDDGLSVATAHCVTLEALEAANGWTDAALQFPPPGAVIRIPPPTPDGSIDC